MTIHRQQIIFQRDRIAASIRMSLSILLFPVPLFFDGLILFESKRKGGVTAVARQRRTREEIGAEIKRLRKEHGYTQLKLGMLVSVDPSKISKLESGAEAAIDTLLLMDICDVFNISLDSLCYVPVVQKDADAEEALTIIMNADPIERKILMKMLRAI